MKKITLSQLLRYSSIGFLGAIALPSSLLINPALSSSELSRSTQNQYMNAFQAFERNHTDSIFEVSRSGI